MATLTVYPDPHTETTSVDGAVRQNNVDLSWANIRGATDGNAALPSTTNGQMVAIGTTVAASNWRYMYRAIFLFDTSALTASASISSATCSFVGRGTDGDDFTQSVSLVQSTPASNTDVTTADYDQVGTTKQATDIPIASFDVTGTVYTDFALNATGLASISKTGVTKFGARCSSDQANSEPSWVSNKISSLYIFWADETDTTTDPKLTITYTLPSAFIPKIIII